MWIQHEEKRLLDFFHAVQALGRIFLLTVKKNTAYPLDYQEG